MLTRLGWLFALVPPGGRVITLQEPAGPALATKYGVIAEFFIVTAHRAWRRRNGERKTHLERFMTTSRDLLMVALDTESGRPPEQGDLSLALAGAELIDLLDVRAIRLDSERIVPVCRPATGDRLLDEAASSLVRQEPYELVGDWLWRRGRGLFASYLAALEPEGQITRQRRRWRRFRTSRTMLADSTAHRAAPKRWTSGDAVLAALAAVAGINGERRYNFPGIADVAVVTVLAAVNAAVTELGLERQRRAIEGDAFDNIWRGA